MKQEEDLITMANTVRDPICGMDIDPANAVRMIERDGTKYYFCSEGCAKTFEAQPGAHV